MDWLKRVIGRFSNDRHDRADDEGQLVVRTMRDLERCSQQELEASTQLRQIESNLERLRVEQAEMRQAFEALLMETYDSLPTAEDDADRREKLLRTREYLNTSFVSLMSSFGDRQNALEAATLRLEIKIIDLGRNREMLEEALRRVERSVDSGRQPEPAYPSVGNDSLREVVVLRAGNPYETT